MGGNLSIFHAKYPGACAQCGGPIQVGDELIFNKRNRERRHAEHYPDGVRSRLSRTRPRRVHLVLSGLPSLGRRR